MKPTQPALILSLGAAAFLLSFLFSWDSIAVSGAAVVVGLNAWIMGARALSDMRRIEGSAGDRVLVTIGYCLAVVGAILGLTATLLYFLGIVF